MPKLFVCLQPPLFDGLHLRAYSLLPFCTSATFVRLIRHFFHFTSESGIFLVPVSPACEFLVFLLWAEKDRGTYGLGPFPFFWRHLKSE